MSIVISWRRAALVVLLALVLVTLMLRQETQSTGAVGASASPITGQCTGQKQGVIKGDVTTKGREGTYAIKALAHNITSPRDPASGLSTGRRQHKPLAFVTNVGPATPKLITALTGNENLTKCTFNFWRTAGTSGGAEKNYFRIVLTNASVASYDLAGRPGGADTVTFTLTYQKIEWTYLDGGITAADDWEAPNS